MGTQPNREDTLVELVQVPGTTDDNQPYLFSPELIWLLRRFTVNNFENSRCFVLFPSLGLSRAHLVHPTLASQLPQCTPYAGDVSVLGVHSVFLAKLPDSALLKRAKDHLEQHWVKPVDITDRRSCILATRKTWGRTATHRVVYLLRSKWTLIELVPITPPPTFQVEAVLSNTMRSSFVRVRVTFLERIAPG